MRKGFRRRPVRKQPLTFTEGYAYGSNYSVHVITPFTSQGAGCSKVSHHTVTARLCSVFFATSTTLRSFITVLYICHCLDIHCPMAPKSGRYSKLPSDEDGEVEEPSQLSPATHRGCWRIFGLGAWVFTTLLLAACLLLLVAAITREPSDRECLIKLSVWCKFLQFPSHSVPSRRIHLGLKNCNGTPAPAFEAVEHVDVQFQNGFHEKSIYRGKPTPDLEQAWLDLWNCRLLLSGAANHPNLGPERDR